MPEKDTPSTDRLTWESQPITKLSLPGLGPKTKEKLARGGILTVRDLLAFLPREYLDYSGVTPLSNAPLEKPVQIRGKLISKTRSKTYNKGIPVLETLVDDGTGALRAVWYNQSFLDKKLIKGEQLALFGTIRFEKLGRTMNNPRFEVLAEDADQNETQIVPIYRQLQGLSSEQLRGFIHALLEQMPDEEILPAQAVAGYSAVSQKQALATLHAPTDTATLKAIQSGASTAFNRLVFEEFFLFQQRMAAILKTSLHSQTEPIPLNTDWVDEFSASLPFQLTDDQMGVIDEIVSNLRAGKRLRALVQGDVGCGKTVIGFFAAFLFARVGMQSALLCPTSVLADQHYRNACDLAVSLGLKPALLTARATAAQNRELLDDIASGKVNLIIGTHRLVQKDAAFQNLALVMVDEQHRFGVDQRAALLKKGDKPHYLAFSATPIPRSLALTLYGDYQVMQIKQKPAGREPVKTILKKAANRDEIIQFARTRLAAGESIFWVFPLIEGDEEQQETSANQMHAFLSQEVFVDHSVGLAHGRMKKEELDAEMERFKHGRHQVLVATTVVEVGVDVPRASVIVIEGADRFGLSQLHQLRGRVGRGGGHAFCFLVLGEPVSQETVKRMRVLERTDDGFEIAYCDLVQRGAGAVLGKRQSGESGFQFGDPWRHRDLMEAAKRAVTLPQTEQERQTLEKWLKADLKIGAR